MGKSVDGKVDLIESNNSVYKIRKRGWFYRFSCWFLKVFLYLIPPYPKKK